MGTIRIVWGTATGPTPMSSYDAALATANIHNYNLVSVSSVIPANATIDVVGEAPPLGPAGEKLTVVEARSTVAPEESGTATACLGWVRESDGPGIFYESSGTDPTAVRERVEDGLTAGRELRSWQFGDETYQAVSIESDAESYTTALVVAVYGNSTPIL